MSLDESGLERLLAGVRAADRRAVGRALSLVEDGAPVLPELLAALGRGTTPAYVIGVTGPPGVGKSSTTTALVRTWRGRGERVGVLAVDPTSPFSGGALLGDRVRMTEHALDPGVLIRSVATRGHLGGLAATTPQALRVLDAAGCAVTVVETVGVGQSEVDVAATADVTLVLLAPGAGDAVQVAKAGVLEVADVLVVSKSDREGAPALARELRSMLSLGAYGDGAWVPPVVLVSATSGTGIDELVGTVEAFRTHAERSGGLRAGRLARARAEVEGLALARLRTEPPRSDAAGLDELAALVADGLLDPYAAAGRLLAGH